MLDDADYTGPNKQNELHHTDHTYKIGNRPALKGLDHEVKVDGLLQIMILSLIHI